MRTLVLAFMVWSSGALAGPLRSIDWCNRGYGPQGPQLDKCTGGVEQRHRAGEGMWGTDNYQFRYASYGDLNHDGHEDALVVMASTLVPVLLEPPSKTPRPVRGALYLIEQRGSDLFIYTTESTDTPPTSIAIKNNVATLVWVTGKRRCSEKWTFTGEGQTAKKSGRTCT